jgi:hypothetical protein
MHANDTADKKKEEMKKKILEKIPKLKSKVDNFSSRLL